MDRHRQDTRDSQALARALADRHNKYADASGAVVTWLNHWSALQVLGDAQSAEALSCCDIVGIDGTLLRLLIAPATGRTSADSVVPLLLPLLHKANVSIIGGRPAIAENSKVALSQYLGPDAHFGPAVDGFDELSICRRDWTRWLAEVQPTVVLLGLGAGLQEQVAMEIARSPQRPALILTCGAFLEQVQHKQYYPSWAYPMKLNWAVRLCREPRRLWRRYSVSALRAVQARAVLRKHIVSSTGFSNYVAALEGGSVESALRRPR